PAAAPPRPPGATVRRTRAHLEKQPIQSLETIARHLDRGVVATFQAAFDDLDERERRTLIALAWCAYATRAEVVAAVTGLDEDETSEALIALAERSLAVFTAGAERRSGTPRPLRPIAPRPHAADPD